MSYIEVYNNTPWIHLIFLNNVRECCSKPTLRLYSDNCNTMCAISLKQNPKGLHIISSVCETICYLVNNAYKCTRGAIIY